MIAGRRRRSVSAVLVAGLLAVTVAGCSGGDAPAWQGGAGGGEATPAAQQPVAAATITAPAQGATDVPASTDIRFTVSKAVRHSVTVVDASGTQVSGEPTADGGWLPEGELKYGTRYTVTVTATGEDGLPTEATSTFTTMAEPANQVRVSSFIGDGMVVGVGMPLMLEFGRGIPADFRDDVQRRLSVRTDPPQEGIWHWISADKVHYRPKTFWRAGTTLSYKAQTGGLPMGDGWYGRNDLTVDAKVGRSLLMTVDNATKTMTVTRDGKVIKKIPVSLGKQRTPSSSGTMLVIEKLRETVFDTSDNPNPQDRYVLDIEYAQRLTWGGEFIHAAPWSVQHQGKRNVSHGCVNMSTADASWLFQQTMVGDPVTVKGTERTLKNGNGWTDWSMSWADYVKGSALPYEPA